MREKHDRGTDLPDELLQGGRESVSGVRRKQLVLHDVDAIELLAGKFPRLTNDGRRYGLPDQRSQLLSRRQRLPGHAMPNARPLLGHHQNPTHMTLASNRSFSTSFAAASFGLPSIICVCLLRCGR